jgi:hypothetical protein
VDAHTRIGRDMGLSDAEMAPVHTLLAELKRLLDGILLTQEVSPRLRARIAAYGELLSSQVGVAFLRQQSVNAIRVDSRALLTSEAPAADKPISEADQYLEVRACRGEGSMGALGSVTMCTDPPPLPPPLLPCTGAGQRASQRASGSRQRGGAGARVRDLPGALTAPHAAPAGCVAALRPCCACTPVRPAAQGFIASTPTGATCLLGRGGSDTSGALFAALVGAQRCGECHNSDASV